MVKGERKAAASSAARTQGAYLAREKLFTSQRAQ